MPAYYLLIAFYVVLAAIVIINLPLARNISRYLYLGDNMRAIAIFYYSFWGLVLVLIHIFIFTHNWDYSISLHDLLPF
ncbi:hypothetical protein KKC60_00555 [Patescibacteria group bacterium]|nr:hypothetical protein [Patescibacteria group bacterium]